MRWARCAAGIMMLAACLRAQVAHAQADAAPAVALAAARSTAREVLGALVAQMAPEDKARLVGLYVAFDDAPADVAALAACDDDGDYVVVVSDALLKLARTVAAAEATDETFGTHKLDEYATFLGAASAPGDARGVRVLPPPPGFFDAEKSRAPANVALEAVRFREVVAAVVGHEVAHLVQGDLVCPNPTATHERGDDVWTREERDHALSVARKLYRATRVLSADGAVTSALLDAGMTERGQLGWLSVVARLESVPTASPATYLELHRDAPVRAEVVRAAADQWRARRAALSPAPSSAARTLSPPMSTDR